MNIIIKQLIISVSLIMTACNSLSACDCIMYPITSYVKTSEYILVVKAVRVHETNDPYMKGYEAEVQVKEVLKGEIDAGSTIHFGSEHFTNCTFRFTPGQEYLVFACKKAGKYVVYDCSYSAERNLATKHYKQLKKYIRKLSS